MQTTINGLTFTTTPGAWVSTDDGREFSGARDTVTVALPSGQPAVCGTVAAGDDAGAEQLATWWATTGASLIRA